MLRWLDRGIRVEVDLDRDTGLLDLVHQDQEWTFRCLHLKLPVLGDHILLLQVEGRLECLHHLYLHILTYNNILDLPQVEMIRPDPRLLGYMPIQLRQILMFHDHLIRDLQSR
jgi:hypothetical protein